MCAAANGDVELVRALIKAGANVKPKNQLGTTAITEAAIIGSAPVIDALLKAGADPNTKNPEGETPLMAWRAAATSMRAKLLVEARAPTSTRRRTSAVGLDVGGRAEPGRDGEVPGVEGRRPQRPRRRPPVGAQGHHGAAAEGHEQGRVHPLLYAARKDASTARAT